MSHDFKACDCMACVLFIGSKFRVRPHWSCAECHRPPYEHEPAAPVRTEKGER